MKKQRAPNDLLIGKYQVREEERCPLFGTRTGKFIVSNRKIYLTVYNTKLKRLRQIKDWCERAIKYLEETK